MNLKDFCGGEDFFVSI